VNFGKAGSNRAVRSCVLSMQREGPNAGLGFGGNHSDGFSPFTTGTLVINDVPPVADRLTGATASLAR
jgi:hypothetical protein